MNENIDLEQIMNQEIEKAKEKIETKNFTGGTSNPIFNQIQWFAPKISDSNSGKSKNPVLFRIVSLPDNPAFESDPTRVLIIPHSKILNDNKKLVNVYWSNDRDWLLWRIYNRLTKYSWTDNPKYNPENPGNEPRGWKKYDYQDNPIFNWVLHNNKEPFQDPKTGKKIDQPGIKPRDRIFFNAVDLLDLEYHFKEKKCKLLTDQINVTANDKGEKVFYANAGFSDFTFNSIIINQVIKAALKNQHIADWRHYAIALSPLNDTPWWLACRGEYAIATSMLTTTDSKFFDKIKEWEQLPQNKKDEMLSWEKWELHNLWKPMSYKSIQKNFSKRIKEIDVLTKENFYDELTELVIQEQKERAEKKNQEKLNNFVNGEDFDEVEEDDIDTPNEQDFPSEVDESPVTPKTRVRGNTSDMIEPYWMSLNTDIYKGLQFLPDSDKKLIVGFDPSTGKLLYDKSVPEDQLYACSENGECTEMAPGSFTHCPKCGRKF